MNHCPWTWNFGFVIKEYHCVMFLFDFIYDIKKATKFLQIALRFRGPNRPNIIRPFPLNFINCWDPGIRSSHGIYVSRCEFIFMNFRQFSYDIAGQFAVAPGAHLHHVNSPNPIPAGPGLTRTWSRRLALCKQAGQLFLNPMATNQHLQIPPVPAVLLKAKLRRRIFFSMYRKFIFRNN
jgi:hypothetical protein